MGVLVRSILVLALCLSLGAGPARAIGGGDSTSKQSPDYAQAAKLVGAGKYADAIPLLEKTITKEKKNADAYNLLGYSHRKLGDVETALTHYGKALELDPKHRGANEYLGELYLELGRLDEAQERLAVLDKACFFGCEEYSELKAMIAAYQDKTGS